jgi:hypothetical protein
VRDATFILDKKFYGLWRSLGSPRSSL